jgi:hypothetical protein
MTLLATAAGCDADGQGSRFGTAEERAHKFGLADSMAAYLRADLLERVRSAVNRAFVEMFCDQHHADW